MNIKFDALKDSVWLSEEPEERRISECLGEKRKLIIENNIFIPFEQFFDLPLEARKLLEMFKITRNPNGATFIVHDIPDYRVQELNKIMESSQ